MSSRHLIIFVPMIATLLVLILGVSLMMAGGKLNEKYGNKLMVARVGLQALTLLCIGIVMFMGK